MTLIWTVVSRFGVVQVSDRLVTRAGASFNPAANKTIVFLARDALVTTSFTGLAYLEGLPTDVWAAHTICGYAVQQMDAREPLPILRTQKLPAWLDVGQATDALRVGFDRAFSGRERSRRQWSQAMPLAGWQWQKDTGRARPVGRVVDKRRGESTAGVNEFVPRHWERGRFMLAATPMPIPFRHAEIATLQDELRTALGDLDGCGDILARWMREASNRTTTIGSDSMAVTIPAPRGTAVAHCRYIPAEPLEARENLAFFTPFVILGEDLLAAPSRIWLAGTAAAKMRESGETFTLSSGESARVTLSF